MRKSKNEKVLKPVRPNAGIEASYRRRLDTLIAEMSASYEHWIVATYRRNRPEMALDAKDMRITTVEGKVFNKRGMVWFCYVDGDLLRDDHGEPRSWRSETSAEAAGVRYANEHGLQPVITESVRFGDPFDPVTMAQLSLKPTPAETLEGRMNELGEQWSRKFDETAPRLAEYFRTDVQKRSRAALKSILKDSGIIVPFEQTPAMRDVAQATTLENVQLIKSIQSKYHDEVQGLVMRSIAAGRDLGTLSNELQARYGITKRRAALIARDQNNKCTAAMTRVRQTELGITEAIWMHSHGGKEPRPTHLKNDGHRFNIAEGWHDPDPKVNRKIQPGELINCRCVSRPIVKGFS